MNWRSFVYTIPRIIASGNAKGLIVSATKRLYSDRTDYLLARDMSEPVEVPSAKIAVHIRPITPADIATLGAEVPDRIGTLKANIPTCYLGVTDSNTICYMQWLIAASHNNARPKAIGLTLEPEEMLLEWAYTFRQFRGLGIMSCAMAQILAEAKLREARRVYTIVECSNIASLKGCYKVGFKPHQVRNERWRLLYRSQNYRPLVKEPEYAFDG